MRLVVVAGAVHGADRPICRSRPSPSRDAARQSRERVFFSEADYELYRDLLREACLREGVAVWSYCLMPNHVHLILAPKTREGLRRALGKALAAIPPSSTRAAA